MASTPDETVNHGMPRIAPEVGVLWGKSRRVYLHGLFDEYDATEKETVLNLLGINLLVFHGSPEFLR